MRKKSHVLLGMVIADTGRFPSIKKYDFLFVLGNALPDFLPTFITRRHRINNSFGFVNKLLYKIIHGKDCRTNVIRMGILTHYICDYFTLPHNDVAKFKLMSHGNWEYRLKGVLLRDVEKIDWRYPNVKITGFEQAIKYIARSNKEYKEAQVRFMNDTGYYSVDIDSYYIRNVTMNVLQYAYASFDRSRIISWFI